ncbi:hypothetical protein ATM97_17010 [Nocardia sp. MH4]|uniref:hypothetical protein n=1 Tax=Nocardia sp. MH4 TaxID=1768677 RepID=UPI001C4E4DC5|nr:hypothetical protein [Nocardia sp. MH4]MBW0274309.1 hypothetical protein [Nocardia sp. MH4]
MDDEDRRKLALAPEDGPGRYLHQDDGLAVVDENGWPVGLEEFLELHADVTAALEAVEFAPVDVDLLAEVHQGLLSMPTVIDVDPLSVVDRETGA